MQKGFITIPRAIERFDVFDDLDALGFYTRLKSYLRFREAYIDGVEVGVNSILISKPELAKRMSISVSKVRRLLNQFQEIGGIKCENIKNKYTLITFLEPFLADTAADTGRKGNPPLRDVDADNTYARGKETDSCERSEDTDLSARGELTAYGYFNNVYLADDEYRCLLEKHGKDLDKHIEKLSAYLQNNPAKNSENHYARLVLWINNERNVGSGFGTESSHNPPKPESEASYDLARAEARAWASVPVFKKRVR